MREHNAFPGGDASADVCVVGAGIAGLTTAYLLTKAGKKVVVLDNGPIGGGESGRTTAHLANAMDDRIYVLEHVHGEERARQIVESHGAAIDKIEEIARAENIDCDFRRLDGFLFLGQGDDESILDEELAAALRTGIVGTEKLPRVPNVEPASARAFAFPTRDSFMSSSIWPASPPRSFVRVVVSIVIPR
jgi:glycine/D-amino acid oxidase-like deaminating enzyme